VKLTHHVVIISVNRLTVTEMLISSIASIELLLYLELTGFDMSVKHQSGKRLGRSLHYQSEREREREREREMAV